MPVLKNDADIRKALQQCRTIAVVGISPEPFKPSYFVSNVLKGKGFKLYLINPNYEGQEILGEKVYASMKQIPHAVDMVDVFRRPSAVPSVADDARALGFKTFWMQPGAENMDVARELDKEGYNVVAGRCAKVESMRLL
ncbi:MAG TPA: CoA-binding protein [Methanotrichaceae archaeon]|nr:CoA-binding protein [Methanotrichaceae archaeon]